MAEPANPQHPPAKKDLLDRKLDRLAAAGFLRQ